VLNRIGDLVGAAAQRGGTDARSYFDEKLAWRERGSRTAIAFSIFNALIFVPYGPGD
jgi:hypothetical protein